MGVHETIGGGGVKLNHICRKTEGLFLHVHVSNKQGRPW